MRFILIVFPLLTACSNVGYRATGKNVSASVQACIADCGDLEKACRDSETTCRQDYLECKARCERWSGFRGEDANLSIELPGKTSK
jgi:hypothetical protein